jgi:hypothetical protein
VDEEFDIYEDLHLDAILVATVGEDGTVTPIEAAGTELSEIYCHPCLGLITVAGNLEKKLDQFKSCHVMSCHLMS